MSLGLAALAWCLESRVVVGAHTTSDNIESWGMAKKSNITANVALTRAMNGVVSAMKPNEADGATFVSLFAQGVLRKNGTHELAR